MNRANQKKPPFYQDELDVYEALWKLEKERGKQFLNEEQVRALVKAGRIAEKEVVQRGVSEEAISKLEQAKLVVSYVLRVVEERFITNKRQEDWKQLNNDQKEKVRWYLFKLVYGISPEYMALKIYKQLDYNHA